MQADGAILALVDADLRVSLDNPLLGELLKLPGSLAGRNLIELLPDGDSVRALDLVLNGVVSEAPITTDSNGDQLMVAMARVGDERWLVLRMRKRPPSAAASTTPPLVGRAFERLTFETFVGGRGRSLLFLEGPLGIGKTALLEAYETWCRSLGCIHFRIDASALDPSDAAIFAAIHPDTDALPAVAALFSTARRLASRRWVLLIDNFDAWLRTETIPRDLFAHIPEECRIVVAARRRPPPAWWGDSARSVTLCTLGPLSEAESLRMAGNLDLDPYTHGPAVRAAQGHPLSIVALAQTQGSSEENREAHALDALTQNLRQAPLSLDILKLAALPARITEDLLADLLENEAEAASTYDALGEICLRDPDGVGLRMPQLLRQGLRERLRRRNPVRYAAQHVQLVKYYAKRLEDGSSAYAPSVVDDLVEALAEQPVLRQVLGATDGVITVRRARRGDADSIDRAARSLGDEAGADDIIRRMESGSCTTFFVERAEEIVGVFQVATVSSSPSAGDTLDRRRMAVQALLGRLATDGPIEGLAVLAFVLPDQYLRRWGEICQACARHLLRTFFASRELGAAVIVVDPARPPHTVHGVSRTTIDGVSMLARGLAGVRPGAIIAELLAANEEMLSGMTPASLPPQAPTLEAIRFALGHLDDLEAFSTSELLTLDACRGADPVSELRRLLLDALDSLQLTVNDRKLHQVIHAVYIVRPGKHEQIAAELGLSYGTFRRNLGRGLERVRELLTQRVSRRSSLPIVAE